MDINQNVIKTLAGTLQVDEGKLTEVLTNPEASPEALGIPEGQFFTNEQKAQFEQNVQKSGYEKGKVAGTEMLFKDIKSKYADIEADDVPTLISKLQEVNEAKKLQEIEALKKELGTGTDERLEALKSQLGERDNSFKALQERYEGEKQKHQNELNSMKRDFMMQGANSEIMRAVGTLQFNVPAEIEKAGDEAIQNFISKKRQNAYNLFKAQYSVDFTEDGKPMFKQGDKIVKDNYENILPVEKFINDFAKENYLEVKRDASPGRGSGNSRSLTGLKACKTRDDFYAYMEKQGISLNTDEGTKMYIEWKKVVNP